MLPAYIRIHDKIKKDIDEGTWKIGQRLPSERDLCETFDVSRMTVRQAITLLVDEGILERKPGSGTFVASSRVKEKMRGTTSFTEIVKAQGKKPSSQLISYKRLHPNEFEIKNLGVLPQSYGLGWSVFALPMTSQLHMRLLVSLKRLSVALKNLKLQNISSRP